jgi:hypothetical protein
MVPLLVTAAKVRRPVLVEIEPPLLLVVVPVTRICAAVEDTVPVLARVEAKRMLPVVELTEVPVPMVAAPVA